MSAGSSTDAALGLGTFAVFNQILSGTGIFGFGRPAAAQPVFVGPPPVVVAPPPVVFVPRPGPVFHHRAHWRLTRGWSPPGLAMQGRC